MIEGVKSVIEAAKEKANENLDQETSKYINEVATLHPELVKAIAKGKTESHELAYGEKDGVRVVPEKNNKEQPKQINEEAFYGGIGLTGMEDISDSLEDR